MKNADEREKLDNENYSKNFTRTPNIVFASYKYLSKEEKYLYIELRFIYWDAKPRFVTLRDLHDLTKFSIGALSKMLPRLHICGLIHAEIRRERIKGGRERGNPKYQITILDIWEINKLYFSCSPNEQEKMDPSQKLVHQMTQACSPNDTGSFTKCDKPVHEKQQGRAQTELAKKDIKTSIKTPLKKEGKSSVSEPETNTPSPSPNAFLLGLSPEARKVHEEWSKMPWFPSNGMGAPVNKTLAAQYEEASGYELTAEIMLKVKEWATSPKVDKKGYYADKGWCFKFFLNELPGWLSKQPIQTSNSNQQNTSSSKAMTHDEASQLAGDAVIQAQENGYQVETVVISHGNEWAVAATWLSGKQSKLTLTSRAQWNEAFIGLSAIADMLQSPQGAK
jgi:hypothetical protein